MLTLFYRNRQLLTLTIVLILVWGLSAFFTLPRLEDPEITQRFGRVVTFLPGATPERVETLVTEKLEQELFELEEVESIRSASSTGVSVLTIELKEAIRNVEPVWAKVRSQVDDVVPDLPPDASKPEYRDSTTSANALIVGLTWELDAPVNYAILRRVAAGLEDQLRAIPGSDKLEVFGDPDEEVRVAIAPAELARLSLTAQSLADQIRASDAKVSAGQLRQTDREFLLEVDSALESLEQVRQIPIRVGASGQVARLGDIARVTKGVQEPIAAMAIVNGYPAVVVSVTVESQERVDGWATQAHQVLDEFRASLSDGMGLHLVLDQSRYVQQRLNGVIANLVTGSVLVIGVSLIMLGWKSALIVGSALPLTTLMVFGCMKGLGIPLHQMSVTGIIIALGLLIDNAIVAVEEVQTRLQTEPAIDAVRQTGQHLAVPLLASTLTTVFAFVPIASSPGSVGEFIGTIGSTVILALLSSLFLSLTVIVALTGRLHRWNPLRLRWHWWNHGFANDRLTALYRWSLQSLFRRPWLGIGLSLILPIVGFTQFATLEQQFFPPTNRDQFQIEWELPIQTTITQTQAQVERARTLIRQHPQIDDVHWFIGKSAPSFFYNLVGGRENAANYAQAIVQLNSTEQIPALIQDLQQELDRAFPDAQILVKQLEQGPPFDAPIEIRIYGSEMEQLRNIGNQLRGELVQIEDVTHTKADLAEALPKLALSVDEVQAQRAGLDYQTIARQLDGSLEGRTGGSILEGTEDIPVRVRLEDGQRSDLDQVASLELVGNAPTQTSIPLDAISDVTLVPDRSRITRRDGQRVNTVQGFITAGSLPDTVLTRFQQRLKQHNFSLPPGYRLEYGGEADARGTAINNLLSAVGVLIILMTATLVLSFNSFGLAGLIASVALCGVGLAALALWMFNSLFGFTAILGTLGLIGLAINDSIVVLAALREHPQAREGDVYATEAVVLSSTRHVLATTLTTVVGFVPLLLDTTGFWTPLAIAIAGGLSGATLLALYYIPAAHILIVRRQQHPQAQRTH